MRVGTGPTSYLLPSILKQFRHTNPGVEVLVETGIIGYEGSGVIFGISIILREATGAEILNKRFETLWKELRDAV